MVISGNSVSAQSGFFHSELERKLIEEHSIGSQNFLSFYLATDSTANERVLDGISQDLSKFQEKLERKRGKYKNDERFLSYLFYSVHRKFLKNYQQFTTFYKMMDKGDYDCLSATTLYSYLLSENDFTYSVIETNYHIYILIKADDRTIMFESTEPLNGFIDDQETVAELIASYRESDVSPATRYAFSFNLENQVELKELIGLLYYNQAVHSLNNSHTDYAFHSLKKAKIFYNSSRLSAFEKLLSEYSFSTVEEGENFSSPIGSRNN
ncbi:MAG: hypothetical protein ACNS60_12725 [Candidatus Cyclobacteriaceae bacterium M2_1C_046]